MILRDNHAKIFEVNSENSVQSTLEKCGKHIQPKPGHIAIRSKGGDCLVKICSSNWNQTQSIDILAPHQGSSRLQKIRDHNKVFSTPVDFKILRNGRNPVRDHKEWIRQTLPTQNIQIIKSVNQENNDETFCELASPTNSIKTFDGLTYNIESAGNGIYRNFIYQRLKKRTLKYSSQST